MGNSNTKESKPQTPRSGQASTSTPNAQSQQPSAEATTHQLYGSRNGRGSRPDLSGLLGIGSRSSGPGSAELEIHKETKQEREARKLAKEKVTRAKERQRSMREEGVDGGFLVTQGVYTGIEDYNKHVVRQLMVGLL